MVPGTFLVHEGVRPNRTQACYARHCAWGIFEMPIRRACGKICRIAVVSNGIDWKDYGAPEKSSTSSSRYRILHLSTLSHLKGALVLMEAIPLVVRQRRDVEFVFAGPWSHTEDKEWAENYITQHDITEHIRFSGQVDGNEKRSLFDFADLFVFPGVQQEGQPLVVLEAMAAGLPVIFTNRGCLRDLVIDGKTGLEVSINDPCQLADRILWLLDHPNDMKAMGKACPSTI